MKITDLLKPVSIQLNVAPQNTKNEDIEKFAEAEQLTAHVNSIKVRFE